MAKSCVVCERGALKAKSISHSHIATNKLQKINIQTKKIDGEKVNICTSCLKSLKDKKNDK